MAFDTTQDGLQDIIEYYYSNKTTRIILLDQSDSLTNASTAADFVQLEPLTEDGYARVAVTFDGWAWNSTNNAIESDTENAAYTASASGTIQFDAIAVLADGGATANVEVTSIASNTFTATAHGLVSGDKVVFTDATAAPSGITLGNTYYVIASGLSADNFRISATEGGSQLSIGGTWTGTLIARNASGVITAWGRRPGGEVFTINPLQSHTVQVRLGMGLRI